MKNKLFIFVLAALTIVLAACGSEKEVIYELKEEGLTTEIVYTAKGDTVTKQKTKQIIDYDLLQVASKEEAMELISQEENEIEDIEGVTYQITYNKDHLIEEVEINTEEIDFEVLSELTEGELDKNSDYISLKESVKLIEEEGFTEKE